ncbi:hypothetical protein CRENBAI_020571 [Crenichthys baileyi]|uniref:FIIND domain-containing protein n=1 Tax=Crenichthys baileyi TaxID=28760 RepID=A0AAV9SGY4_9TELE
MKGEGDVFYRIVPWSRRSLSQHGKKPAGPLFDIRCQQQSLVQLHLPHCEIRSTGGCHFLSVAHVHDEGIEFIRPEKITEAHVIINITGFSAFGIVKDEDSPPDPEHCNLKRTRKKLFGLETFIDDVPNCKLQPNQLYTLSTCPGHNLVLVQPTEAEFDAESYNN